MRGKITMENYEAWLLDRIEGRLTASQEVELQNFLILHPELDADLSDFGSFTLPEFDEKFDSAELLREFDAKTESLLRYVENELSDTEKTKFESELAQDAELQTELQLYLSTRLQPEKENFSKAVLIKSEDDLLLASPVLNYLENQVSEFDRTVLAARFVQEPDLHKELEAYQAAILQPDLSITYPNKNTLVRSSRIIPLFGTRAWQFSAAAVLVFLLLGFLYQSTLSLPDHKVDALFSEVSVPSKTEAEAPGRVDVNTKFAQLSKTKKATVKGKFLSTQPAQNKNSVYRISKYKEVAENKQLEIGPKEIQVALIDSMPKAVPMTDETGETSLKYASVDDLQTTEELTEFDFTQEKTSVWHKAVNLAKRFNRMGFTAVNGMEERKTRSYRLSFNSFTVEKK